MQRKPEAKTTEVANELTQEELDKVSAGKSDKFVTSGALQGESIDVRHKDPVEI